MKSSYTSARVPSARAPRPPRGDSGERMGPQAPLAEDPALGWDADLAQIYPALRRLLRGGFVVAEAAALDAWTSAARVPRHGRRADGSSDDWLAEPLVLPRPHDATLARLAFLERSAPPEAALASSRRYTAASSPRSSSAPSPARPRRGGAGACSSRRSSRGPTPSRRRSSAGRYARPARDADDARARAPRSSRTRQRTDAGPTAAAKQSRRARRPRARPLAHGARDVARLHEALCFLRAYPDDAARPRRTVERSSRASPRRADLAPPPRARSRTAASRARPRASRSSRATARWLAARWADRLRVDWQRVREASSRSSALLPLVSLWAETPGLDELDLGPRGWVKRLKGPAETDAAFLVRRLATLGRGDLRAGVRLYESLELPLVLDAGPGHARADARAASDARRRLPDAARSTAGRPDVRARGRAPRRSPSRAVSPARGRRAPRPRARGDGHAPAGPRRLPVGRPARRPPRDCPRRARVRRDRRRPRAPAPPRVRLRLPDAQERRADRLRPRRARSSAPPRSPTTSSRRSAAASPASSTARSSRWRARSSAPTSSRSSRTSSAATATPRRSHPGAWWFYRKLGFRPARAARRRAHEGARSARMATRSRAPLVPRDAEGPRLGEPLLSRGKAAGRRRSASSSCRTSASR